MSEFKSKRNRVWLEGYAVHKRVTAGSGAAQAEAEILSRLNAAGAAVPQVIDIRGDTLVLEYIEGLTLADEIGREFLPVKKIARGLADWFAAFYAAYPGKIRGDVNCRNFIVGSSYNFKIFGVDFEDLPDGRPEIDLGRMCAFILTYEPQHTRYKKSLAQALADCFGARFGVERELAAREQARELEAMRERRK